MNTKVLTSPVLVGVAAKRDKRFEQVLYDQTEKKASVKEQAKKPLLSRFVALCLLYASGLVFRCS